MNQTHFLGLRGASVNNTGCSSEAVSRHSYTNYNIQHERGQDTKEKKKQSYFTVHVLPYSFHLRPIIHNSVLHRITYFHSTSMLSSFISYKSTYKCKGQTLQTSHSIQNLTANLSPSRAPAIIRTCLGLPTKLGNITGGLSSPAKPA